MSYKIVRVNEGYIVTHGEEGGRPVTKQVFLNQFDAREHIYRLMHSTFAPKPLKYTIKNEWDRGFELTGTFDDIHTYFDFSAFTDYADLIDEYNDILTTRELIDFLNTNADIIGNGSIFYIKEVIQ